MFTPIYSYCFRSFYFINLLYKPFYQNDKDKEFCMENQSGLKMVLKRKFEVLIMA